VRVTVLEKNEHLSLESRASTFHPPTLDKLDDLGFADALIAEGLKAPRVQYASTIDGILGTFDFGDISDLTRHPFRVQAEQFKLTRIILEGLKENPLFDIRFNGELKGLSQDANGVTVTYSADDAPTTMRCDWLIGADGASSAVRRCQNIPFEGFTWPERFLVVTTSADVEGARPGVTSVSYWADPQRWHFFLRIPGAWRIMFPVEPDVPDEVATSPGFARQMLASILPDGNEAPIDHVTLYRVHQRVAECFRKGRTFLAGDAAHINNPLGGMGMNGGVHDALNLRRGFVRSSKGMLTPTASMPTTGSDAQSHWRRSRTPPSGTSETWRRKHPRTRKATGNRSGRPFRMKTRSVLSCPASP
ncbi:MAG TPA: FAD-dependent monooxygenase, partial [Pyrinomonadaceae bacterium]|nr:FAD-dependent monooxygenase [Pyrinomonadaceae bacterium]